MKNYIIKSKYFLRRNYASFFIVVLIASAMHINNEAVHLKAANDLGKRKQAKLDSLQNCSTALILRKALADRGAYLVENNKTLNGLNRVAERQGRGDAKPWHDSLVRNDSLYNDATQKYTSYIAHGERKIEAEYDRALNGTSSGLPITDKSAFALSIPIIAAASISLLSKIRNKASRDWFLVASGVTAGLVAIAAVGADWIMMYYRLNLLWGNVAYATLGAFVFSGGIIIFTISHHLVDKNALCAEMNAEIKETMESTQIETQQDSIGPLKGLMSLVHGTGTNPLRNISLERYDSMQAMPTTRDACCEIYAAYLLQKKGNTPSWLSYKKLEFHLRAHEEENAGLAITSTTLHRIVESLKTQRKAA